MTTMYNSFVIFLLGIASGISLATAFSIVYPLIEPAPSGVVVATAR